MGELPAHGRRGARGRDAGDRDARRAASPRSCATARTGCSSSPATSTRSPSRSTASSPTPSSPRGCARTPRRSVADVRGRARLRAARGDPAAGRRGDAARALRRPHALPAAARREPRAQVGRALGAHGRARARERHRLRPALPARAAAAARRAALLRRRCRFASRASCARSGPTSCRREPVRGGRGRARARGSRARAAKVVVEVHGDWRRLDAALRLVAARALLGPAGDRLASWAVRRADGHRAVSRVHGVARARPRAASRSAVFTTYSDLGAFAGPGRRRCRTSRASLFVGVLERYKNVDGLAAAWRLVRAARSPRRGCTLVGDGTQVEVAEGARARGRASGTAALEPPEVARRARRVARAAPAVARRRACRASRRGVPARPRGRRRARPAGSRTSSRTA